MSTSPASGLSAEAKEFVPISSPSTTTTTTVPLYVDENTVASLYPSDHQPLMVQTIYPMMLTNSKGTDNMQFPEIEFHIQPSQQQAQFHIDSQASPVTNGNSSTTTSQIVLLPTTNSVSGFYPTPQILYSPNEPISGYYPMDYCEPSLINFSLQQSNLSTKSNRILSQHSTRGNTFRQQHGAYRSTSRANHRGGGNSIRNSYYDYSNRRNGSSGRGNSSVNKRISSSYHSHDYNNYYHSSSSSRSRGGGGGYSSRSTQNHDDYRKDQYDYYNSEKDSYDNDYHQTSQMNDDGTPFEFRPEDFPSLPNNPSQQSDKSPPTVSTNPKPASSWNTIVSSNPPRPHSTSPHSLAPTQDSRSDRSRSFNTKSSTKKSAHQPLPPPASQPNNRASKNEDHSQQHLINKTDLPKDDNIDDGFIQTKQQHRRLKRRHKIKEEPVPFSLNDEQTLTNIQIENDHQSKTSLPETFNSLNISSSENIEKTDTNITENNSNHSSSSSSNSSDTSDYDDAVDNFDAE